MAAFNIPFTILQGETYNEVSTWKTGTPATPVDLTGCTARAQVRASITASKTLLELTTENGGIVLGGIEGTVRRIVDARTTADIRWTEAIYDLEIVYPDGVVRRLLAGEVSVSPEVTRD